MTDTRRGLFLVLIAPPLRVGKTSLLLLLISLKLGKSLNKGLALLFKALKVCGRALNKAFPTFGNG
ncbi:MULTISPECIES: hypothetical protein [unclassified Bartonella]|uniref:hypothetical protein n=1 Tax=unclassified Bartonella TaxID=2645622 RepID=UPI0035D03A2B